MFVYVIAPVILLVMVVLVPAIVLGVVSRLDRRANWLDKKAAEAAAEAATAASAEGEAAAPAEA